MDPEILGRLLVGGLAGGLKFLFLGIVIKLGGRIFAKVIVPYKRAYLIAFAVVFTTSVATLVASVPGTGHINNGLSFVDRIVIGSVHYGLMIKRSDGDPIGLGKGMDIHLFSNAIWVFALITLLGVIYFLARIS